MADTDENTPLASEPSLDQLSQAFAEAMGRTAASSKTDVSAEGDDGLGDGLAATTPSEVDAVDANDACPISPKSVLEAILFVGHPEDEPIASRSVANLLRGVEPNEVDELVVALNKEYVEQGVPLRIESLGAGYRLRLQAEFEHVRQRFYGRIREARLSRAAIDVLAIVAYNQPVTRKEVDELTGANMGRILSQLVRRQLVAQQTTEEKPRKKQYVTTTRFLQLFGLADLADLPRSDEPQ